MTKKVDVLQRREILIVSSYSMTVDGWCIVDSVFSLSARASDSELVQTVRSAFLACRVDVPQPSDLSELTRPVLEAARAKSWRALMKEAAVCEVVLSEDAYLVFQTRVDRRGGVEGTEPPQRISSTADVAEFAGAIRRALIATEHTPS